MEMPPAQHVSFVLLSLKKEVECLISTSPTTQSEEEHLNHEPKDPVLPLNPHWMLSYEKVFLQTTCSSDLSLDIKLISLEKNVCLHPKTIDQLMCSQSQSKSVHKVLSWWILTHKFILLTNSKQRPSESECPSTEKRLTRASMLPAGLRVSSLLAS